MKRIAIAFIIIVLLPVICLSQQPDEKLNQWGTRNPIQKVYLHLDREEYMAGQTVWFKAYLYSEYQPDDKSTSLYVELVEPVSSTIISRKTFPVYLGVSRGQLELPDTLSSKPYILRAYTTLMLNHEAAYLYNRPVTVTGKKYEPVVSKDKNGQSWGIEFFPEGGNFVAGMGNTVAFKATAANGLPYAVKNAGVYNSKNQLITSFDSYHDGMGMIDMTPEAGESYYVMDSISKIRFPLPEVSNKGIVFRLLTGDDGIHFEIAQQKNDKTFQAAYMIGQMQHHVVFKQPLKEGVAALSGVIKTNNLQSGILHITVFNKDGMPLAERLSFIDNKEYILKAELLTDTVSFEKHGRNHFTLALADTVVGSISVSVTDPAYNANARRTENIISRFLLSSDLQGYVHNPAYYFSSNNSDSAKYALDLVMMTNGWRRFKWTQLLKDSMPAAKYTDAGFIALSGRVLLEGTKKPFADKEMMMFIVAVDSSKTVQMMKTDADGNYRLDSLIFFDKATILFSDIRGRKSKFLDIKPGSDSLGRSYLLPAPAKEAWQASYAANYGTKPAQRKMIEEYDAYLRATGVVLSEIVIKTKKKTPLEELEEKYASGAFSGDSRKTFDLLNTDEAVAYNNIFDYLSIKMPGFQALRTNDGDWAVYMRQMATISSLGNQQMDIFLDEVLTDAGTVAFIPPAQIAMVKVYSTFVGSTGGGAGGALAIYMKKGADYFNSLPSAGEILTYNGYSVIKEFYSPDYAAPAKASSNPDHRMTLHWKPDILLKNVNPKVPLVFYNNDRTGSFKVVVEGLTINGKMVMLEQIVNKKGF